MSDFIVQSQMDPQTEARLREELTKILAPNYMTTSTAKDPAVVQEDARADSVRLKAAVDAVLGTL